MNIAQFIADLNLFDLLVILVLFAMFILGFIQGTVRRLLGIGSILFSFFFAANAKDSLGSFLASNWRQFPPEYGVMIGFLIVFVAASLAFSLVIQGTYKKTPLFEKNTFVDEIIAGVLGVFQGLMILTFITIILDTYFMLQLAKDPDELPFLRELWNAIDTSAIGALLHSRVIPTIMTVAGLLIPASIRVFYVSVPR